MINKVNISLLMQILILILILKLEKYINLYPMLRSWLALLKI
nr:MAG TPA: hypothetical protein [Caudoviricetes sp.]